jgi:hypothetical protein
LQKNKAGSTKFSKTGICKGKETTTTEKAADRTRATTASERRYSADVTSLKASVALQRHTEEATPTHKKEEGGTRSRRVSKKTEEKVNQLLGPQSRSCFTYRTKLISRCLTPTCP